MMVPIVMLWDCEEWITYEINYQSARLYVTEYGYTALAPHLPGRQPIPLAATAKGFLIGRFFDVFLAASIVIFS